MEQSIPSFKTNSIKLIVACQLLHKFTLELKAVRFGEWTTSCWRPFQTGILREGKFECIRTEREEVKNQIIRSFCFTMSESQILRQIHLIKVMGRLAHKI